MLKTLMTGLIMVCVFCTCPAFGQDKDLVILDEENEIIFSGESMEFIVFTVNKQVKYKIGSETGIEKGSSFVLPESFDPSYITHFPKARNYTHVYSRMKCDYFKAKIYSETGQERIAEIRPEKQKLKIHMPEENYYGDYTKFIYHIDNLQVGDELHIEYSYNLLYNENSFKLSGLRIFFNSDINKLNYKLMIQHHPELVVDYDFINGAEPDSISIVDGIKKSFWIKNNLSGCIDEPGSKPHLSLPYIVLTPRPYDLLYVVPHSYEERLTPIYSMFAKLREAMHFSISVSIMEGVNTRQYELIEKYIKRQISDIDNDSTGLKKITSIHNNIVEDFEFADDIDYFTREDRRNHRMGEYLQSGQIRDISRYDIYLALIRSLGLKYFTAYLCDTRSGEISDNFLKPMHYDDYIFVVITEDDVAYYLYPKKDRFGYYIDEIPFYYENAKARLIHLLDYRNSEEAISEEYREALLPKSNIGMNSRSSRIMVNVDLEELIVTFSGKVSLSGQFSTMTRGAYLYDYQDETVNELYGRKIWEINNDTEVLSKSVKIKKKVFPYPSEVTTKYQANNIIELNQDTINLEISNWFNHIIYKDFSSEDRHLDFYPDFAHRDTYSYMIKFDKDVELVEMPKSVNIIDEAASLMTNIEQIDNRTIRVTSHMAISDKIEVDNIELVQKIYNHVQMLNSSSIKLILK